jgi:hypothetical protein
MYYDDLFLQLKKKHQMGHQTWQASPWLDMKIYKNFTRRGRANNLLLTGWAF